MIEYYTIQPDEDVKTFLNRLYADFRLPRLRITDAPVKLMGNAKVLTVNAVGTGITIKVDGPGMMIDELYKEILQRYT